VKNEEYLEFEKFCQQAWEPSKKLVKEAHELQKNRKKS